MAEHQQAFMTAAQSELGPNPGRDRADAPREIRGELAGHHVQRHQRGRHDDHVEQQPVLF